MEATTEPLPIVPSRARALVFIALFMVICVVVAAVSYRLGKERAEREIGRLASTALAANIRLKEAFNTGQLDKANKEIDVQTFENLILMQLTHEKNLAQTDYARQVPKTIAALKRVWLKFPPYERDASTNEFIDSICATTDACPKDTLKTPK
jgi:hypothetical protein